jgi:hypothetical protein
MEQRYFSEDNGHLFSLLWSLNVYYYVYKIPAAEQYPKPDESSPYPHILFFHLHFQMIFPSKPRSRPRHSSGG